MNIDESNTLTSEQKKELMILLRKHKEIFATSDTDIGICNRIKHRIDLVIYIPFKQRHRRIHSFISGRGQTSYRTIVSVRSDLTITIHFKWCTCEEKERQDKVVCGLQAVE